MYYRYGIRCPRTTIEIVLLLGPSTVVYYGPAEVTYPKLLLNRADKFCTRVDHRTLRKNGVMETYALPFTPLSLPPCGSSVQPTIYGLAFWV